MSGPAPEVPGEAAPADGMHCGGCGAKVASPVLSAALARIDPGMRRDVIVGLDTPDDAAILETPPGTLLVQSVDHFRALRGRPLCLRPRHRGALSERPLRDGRAGALPRRRW